MPHRPSLLAVAILGVSLFVLTATPLSYALNDRGALTLVLFTFGLGGEGNVGAWWSGSLFLLAAICALDRAVAGWSTTSQRHGWAALAAALALLSFDEIASLHEFLSARNRLYLVPLGALGLGLVAFAFAKLQRTRAPVGKLALAFGLLATVPVQERVQHAVEWASPVAYGLRALVEEGTELAAVLVLLSAASGGLLRLGARDRFSSVGVLGWPLLWLAVAALPILCAAAYALNLAGAANWLGGSLFFACALLALKHAAASSERAALGAAAWYLLASLGTNAVRPDWDPVVLGIHANLRGIYFGALLLAAPWLLAAGAPWRQRAFWLTLAACTLGGAFALIRPQILWSTWPPTIALLCFYIEISALRLRAAAAPRRPVVPSAPGLPAPGVAEIPAAPAPNARTL